MEYRDLSNPLDLLGHMPFALRQRFRDDKNSFAIASLIDFHTVTFEQFLTSVFSESTRLVRERVFGESSCEGRVSRKNILLNPVFVCRHSNNLSLGCLVKSGYEIKLSKYDSFIAKEGKKMMRIEFVDSFWIADFNSSQGAGSVTSSTPTSTRSILRILEKGLIKDLKRAEYGQKSRRLISVFKTGQYDYRKYKIKKHTRLRGDNVTWVLNSRCSVHVINDKKLLTNLRSWKDPLGYERWSGDYMLGNFLLKDVDYSPLNLSNFLSLNKLAEEGFEFYLTNEEATISKNGEVHLTVPMVGKYWIVNSLHEQKGWLKNGCPHEIQSMLEFEKLYGCMFTREEIKKAFGELTHECELEGPTKRFAGAGSKI